MIKISLWGSLIFTLCAACNVLRDSLWIIWGILHFYHLKSFFSFSINLLQSQNVCTLTLKNVRHPNKHSLIHSLLVICILVKLICSFGQPLTYSLNFTNIMLTSLIILFQRFSTPPTIFVTASHPFPKRPQDAMAVWVEELRVDNFKICLREAKIFDGPHKGIKIVSKIVLSFAILTNKALPKNCISSKLSENIDEIQLKRDSI